MMKWGILDTVDDLWLGRPDEDGPLVFDSEQFVDAEKLAMIAAEIASRRAGWPPTRARAREYTVPAGAKRDELPLKSTTLEILAGIERGKIV